MSWDLKVGEFQEKYLTDEEIWVSLNNFFFCSHVTMSYKYGFLKALLENLYEVNDKLEINYNNLFYSFTNIYWNLVIHHELWQSNNKNMKSSIQRISEESAIQYNLPKEVTFEKLPAQQQLNIVQKVKDAGKKYVIGAFYSDTNKVFYEFRIKGIFKD